jgi:hypothetical protein
MKCFTKISFYLSLNRVQFSLLVLFTGLLFVGTFILQSCEKNTFTHSSENGTVIVSKNSDNEYFADMDFGDSKFIYFTQTNTLKSSCGSSSAIQSNFQVKRGNAVIYNTTFELDTTIRDYRLLQHKKIEQIAKSLNNNLTEDDYAYVAANIETFITEIVKTKSFNKASLQSLFFHKSIANAKLREKQTGVLECVPSPFYIVGRSFYSDVKDINLPKQTVQSVLKSHPEIKDSKGVPELNAFLNNLKSDNISFDQIYFLFVDKQRYIQFLDNTPNKTGLNLKQKSSRIIQNKQGVQKSEGVCDCSWWCPLGCGCDWGCCGNYEGCCLFADPICLVHDAICTCCEPAWFCFSGCVKDPGCP